MPPEALLESADADTNFAGEIGCRPTPFGMLLDQVECGSDHFGRRRGLLLGIERHRPVLRLGEQKPEQ